MTFKPFAARPSLSTQVYEAIKRSILSLELQPGEVLSIGDLAVQFEISRTPVRDALLLLEKDELVTLMPHKGAKVTEITAQDVKEIYELRTALESYAVRTAAPHLTDQDLQKLEEIIHASRHALDEQQYLLASDLGREFHDVFIQKLENRRLTTYLQDLDTLYTRLRRFSALMAGRLEKSHEQHLAILQELQESDAVRAGQAMAEHLMSVSDELLKGHDTWVNEMEHLLNKANSPDSDAI